METDRYRETLKMEKDKLIILVMTAMRTEASKRKKCFTTLKPNNWDNKITAAVIILNRFCLVLNGREAIREALLKHAVPFADRFDAFIEKAYVNKNAKGRL